jgi:DNA-directed RNA polymerase subunit H (RpoH/RPB5)
MKMTNGKTHELAPLYMEANTEQKKELLKKYGIGKTTFYAALKRYHMSIVKMLA